MPRRENSASAGLVAVRGTYDQVRVGSLIQGHRATLDDVWEVVDLRNPEQYDHGTTPWFLVQNRATGERMPIPPRTADRSVTFMVPEETVDPDERRPKLDPATVGERDRVGDADAVMLLVEELGATSIAWQDRETGIVYCPSYESMSAAVHWEEYMRHLEIAHGMDLSDWAKDPANRDVALIGTLHGKAHSKTHTNPRPTGGGGFPHHHDSPDLDIPFGPGMRATVRENKKKRKANVSEPEM